MSITAILLLAEGFEEIETATTLDVLRRADIQIISASLSVDKLVVGSRNITFQADKTLEESIETLFDLVILPGGMPGAKNLRQDLRIPDFLEKHHRENRALAAICAAPYVLGELGFLDGKKATSYPTFQNRLGKSTVINENVVVDGKIITSQGVGTALDFALTLVSIFKGEKKSQELAEAMLVPIN